jgi:hypothetical protein
VSKVCQCLVLNVSGCNGVVAISMLLMHTVKQQQHSSCIVVANRTPIFDVSLPAAIAKQSHFLREVSYMWVQSPS